MDTSKEYVKMCENATEIQTGKELDLFLDNEQLQSQLIVSNDGVYWMPRQDQLQEMMGQPILESLSDFGVEYGDDGGGLSEPEYMPYPTLEQLWLALLMKNKYKKKWDGESWEMIVEHVRAYEKEVQS